jgi:hypothetical protein
MRGVVNLLKSAHIGNHQIHLRLQGGHVALALGLMKNQSLIQLRYLVLQAGDAQLESHDTCPGCRGLRGVVAGIPSRPLDHGSLAFLGGDTLHPLHVQLPLTPLSQFIQHLPSSVCALGRRPRLAARCPHLEEDVRVTAHVFVPVAAVVTVRPREPAH